MESPPHYMPPAPKRKSPWPWIIGITIGVALLCCGGAVGFGVWGWNKLAMPLAQCGTTFTSARDALLEYAKEHDGKLPPAANWEDEVRPYYDKVAAAEPGPFKASREFGCDDGSGGRTGIAFNSELAGKLEKEVGRDEVVLFEIRRATANASQKYEPRGISDSPRIMNDPRGWFMVYISGPAGLDGPGGFKPMDTRGGSGR